jgi:glycogen phosphorylase
VYAVGDAWTLLNAAGCGKFYSDYTIAQYAADIWRAQPCPVR